MIVQASRRKIARAAIAVLAATAPPAAAQPAPAPAPAGPPASAEPTATDLAGAPQPGDESGRIDAWDRDSSARRALRGVLYVPKVLVEVVLAPVQVPVWAYDRYHLDELYYRVFYNEDRTIGLVPTASYATEFGFTVGAKFINTDLAGQGESLWATAQFGGSYQQAFQAYVDSGDRLGDHLLVSLFGAYEKHPKEIFYGIGNHDTTDEPPVPVDPYTTDVTVKTRFRQRIERFVGAIDWRMFDDLYLVSSHEVTDRHFSPATTGTPINEVFNTATLVGWPSTKYYYTELALRYDTRGRYNLFEPAPFFSRGTLVEAWGGFNHALNALPDYWRYGLNLQHFIRMAQSPRVVMLRFHGEAVSAGLDDVPFDMLPRLGGPRDLRGYTPDRFRDRIAWYGTVEYSWDLSFHVAAALFTDVGRVYRSFDDITYKHMRAGFGLALRFYGENSFWLDASLATSVDGGVQATASFDPVYFIRPRARRR
jgi:outer membrane protein assembly factor BamA